MVWGGKTNNTQLEKTKSKIYKNNKKHETKEAILIKRVINLTISQS